MTEKVTRFASAMRDNERKHFRNEDLQAGVDFETALKLGCFNKELMYYAVAYVTPQGVACRVSAKEHTMQQFVYNALEEGIYPTPIKQYIRRLPVPSGQENALKMMVKKEAARKVLSLYNDTYFQCLSQLTALEANDHALSLLLQWKDQLEGIYHREGLDLYRGLVYTALESKVLCAKNYFSLKQWINHIYKQLENDIIPKSQYKKTMAAFAYSKDMADWRYFFDARVEVAINKKEALEKQQYTTTPIFTREKWLADMNDFGAMRESFMADYKAYCEQFYLNGFKQIKTLPSVISAQAFEQQEKIVKENSTKEAYEAFCRYKKRWNL